MPIRLSKYYVVDFYDWNNPIKEISVQEILAREVGTPEVKSARRTELYQRLHEDRWIKLEVAEARMRAILGAELTEEQKKALAGAGLWESELDKTEEGTCL